MENLNQGPTCYTNCLIQTKVERPDDPDIPEECDEKYFNKPEKEPHRSPPLDAMEEIYIVMPIKTEQILNDNITDLQSTSSDHGGATGEKNSAGFTIVDIKIERTSEDEAEEESMAASDPIDLKKCTQNQCGINAETKNPHHVENHSNQYMNIDTGEKHCIQYTGSPNFPIDEYYLSTHKGIHTDQSPFSCHHCPKTFTQKSNYIRHLICHTDEKPYSCNVCDTKFKYKNNLSDHMKCHGGYKPHSCNLCQKRFTRKIGLTYHMGTHTGEKPFACDLCQKRFTLKNNLTNHMMTHTGEKPYACQQCQTKFRNKSDLTKHIRIHTREKPYSCGECEKKYTHRSSLAYHMGTHKSFGEKELFSCHQCNKKFSSKSYLKIHLSTHNEKDKFSCHICQKKFSYKANLKRHLKIHASLKAKRYIKKKLLENP